MMISIKPKVTMEITDLTTCDNSDMNIFTPFQCIKSPDYVEISVDGCNILISKSRFKKYPRVRQIEKFYKYLTKQGYSYTLYHIYGKPQFDRVF